LYIPKPFHVTDIEKLTSFIKEYSFGTLFSQTGSEPFATHLPFLIEQDGNGFKIKINRFEGKWKLNQNHSVERRKRLIDGLRKTREVNSNMIADLMDQTILENQ
jgi:predicted FMN-binding regulatory protein PaiB